MHCCHAVTQKEAQSFLKKKEGAGVGSLQSNETP